MPTSEYHHQTRHLSNGANEKHLTGMLLALESTNAGMQGVKYLFGDCAMHLEKVTMKKTDAIARGPLFFTGGESTHLQGKQAMSEYISDHQSQLEGEVFLASSV